MPTTTRWMQVKKTSVFVFLLFLINQANSDCFSTPELIVNQYSIGELEWKKINQNKGIQGVELLKGAKENTLIAISNGYSDTNASIFKFPGMQKWRQAKLTVDHPIVSFRTPMLFYKKLNWDSKSALISDVSELKNQTLAWAFYREGAIAITDRDLNQIATAFIPEYNGTLVGLDSVPNSETFLVGTRGQGPQRLFQFSSQGEILTSITIPKGIFYDVLVTETCLYIVQREMGAIISAPYSLHTTKKILRLNDEFRVSLSGLQWPQHVVEYEDSIYIMESNKKRIIKLSNNPSNKLHAINLPAEGIYRGLEIINASTFLVTGFKNPDALADGSSGIAVFREKR